MGLIAPVLMAIVAFYWVAGCFTILAWLKALGHLLEGNFIRTAIWFNVGTWLLFWWFDKPHDWDSFMPFACFFVALGSLAAFARHCKKRQAMQAMPTMPVWTMPTEATGNITPIIEVEYKRLPG